MLLSLSHRFIFIANVKAASTAVEQALRDVCEIRMDQSRFGKHATLGDVERRFAAVFDVVPRSAFRVFGVVRDPVDWFFSLYRSHKSVHFENSELSTGEVSFAEFLDACDRSHPGQCVPQQTYFTDMSGRLGADYLIRFDHLDEDFGQVLETLGVPPRPLPHENASIDLPETEAVSDDMRRTIQARYAGDIALASRAAGRWLGDEDRVALGRPRPAGDFDVSEAAMPPRLPNRARPLTRDDVIWAYRMLLNRDPEDDRVIEGHRAAGDRGALRATIMQSVEFQRMVRPEAEQP